MLTRKQKALLRAYYRSTYAVLRIRADGTVEAKKNLYNCWGVLLSPRSAREAVVALEARQAKQA